MVNPNKRVKRPNGLGSVYRYHEDDDGKALTLPIMDLIKEYYIYLYRAIEKENYYIKENDSCYFFKEVLNDENEVVGFAAYRISSFNKDSLVLKYYYVLPEYRNTDLFPEELDDSTMLFESSIIIEYPTRDMVQSLIDHKIARVFDDRFVISRLGFIMPIVPISDANTLREEYEYPENVTSKISLIYDLELCAVVGLSVGGSEKIYDGEETEEDLNNFNNMSLVLSDDAKYNPQEKRANDPWLKEGTYFKHVKQFTDENESLIKNWLSII